MPPPPPPPLPPPPGAPPSCSEADKATVKKVWAAMGGEVQKLTKGSDNVGNWNRVVVEDGRITRLKLVAWYGAELSGVIPKEIGDLDALTSLYLGKAVFGDGKNCLSGEIPKEIGNCTALTTLRLDENELSGVIPKEIGNCTKLTC
ncbi:hypothetical protein TrLO_g1621 [Triparma laevis f. longispina]|uniref:Uncharacterized protein n=1 Tax=Triparma laevis f. longispina TaxID=1714387 RepID=A0A9W7AJ06_9STRA|nr:hypothetical protein TrLO_g1621 [Triparma laevis f. longispina]